MRIIIVNDHGSITGGAAQVAIASLNALAKIGIDITFVSSVGPVDKNIDIQKVRVINFGFDDLLGNSSRLNAAIHGIWDTRCAERFGSILDEYDRSSTVIHLHTWVQSLSSSVIHEIIKRRFKIVVTLHDYFTVCPNGGLYNYVENGHCLLEPMSVECALSNCDSRNRIHKFWRFFRHLVQNNVCGMPSHIENFISVSDYSEILLRPHLKPTSRFFRVRNPIDIDKTSPPNVCQNKIFTFVGRLSPEKGVKLFAIAAKNANVRAAFVGRGSQDIEIRKIYPEASLLGWNDRHGVISHIRASRAIVFPSLLHETQGMVVSEAAALGVPSIVSDACSARDSIIDGETGLLFRSGDVDDLTDKIILLNSNPVFASKMGKSAFDKYWSNPSTLTNHIQELVACYKSILDDR